MKVSANWLKEWVPYDKSTKEIASILTMSGLEVDQVIPVAGEFTRVIVAEVIDTKVHPNADKLTVCQVKISASEVKQVVCGAQNVRTGLKVAFAQVGATLPNDINIKSAKLRDVLSDGMLCSAVELGMAETSEGILELEEEAPVGMCIREYLNLNDEIFDIEFTPNRGDCLSVQGVARELAAKLDICINTLKLKKIKTAFHCPINVEIQNKEFCISYCGRVIKNFNKNAKSPLWLKEKLRRSGMRSIHPIVDITQYVMLELGQPLHAFDMNSIQEKIIIRDNYEGEWLKLLDGQTVKLNQTVIIADKTNPLAIAGVMGGEASAVNDATNSIFLESAFFSPQKISGVARSYALTTDSSYRFERGVDPFLPQKALDRATALIQEILGGEASEIVSMQQKSHFFEKKQVVFRPASFFKRIGINIASARMQQILEKLGFSICSQNETQWILVVPSYRFDISIEDDVIEELIRVEGYDKIEPKSTILPLRAINHSTIEHSVVKIMQHLGYNEVINYSFVDGNVQKILFPAAKTLALSNPISPELSEMRVSLWPGLLANMFYNLNRQQEKVSLFECGRVFDVDNQEYLKETQMLAAILVGTKNENDWALPQSTYDFYDMKGDIEALFKALAVNNIEFKAQNHASLHPGKTAGVYKNGEQIALCGALHPSLAQEFEVTNEILLFECKLDALIPSNQIIYTSISKFPKIKRDLAFIADKDLTFATIDHVIREVADPTLLKNIQVFDVYIGENIPDDKKSLAINLIIQSKAKTLTDEEIQKFLHVVIEELKVKCNMVLRDGT